MATNNELYLEKLNEVRGIEAEYDGELDPFKKAGLLARLKSYQADATFFAAEAYHSEGPLQHVVKAGQSSRLEIESNGTVYATKADKDAAINSRKQDKLAALSPNQMLQSFNENLGDPLARGPIAGHRIRPNPQGDLLLRRELFALPGQLRRVDAIGVAIVQLPRCILGPS